MGNNYIIMDLKNYTITLASASPRRKQLLEQAELTFTIRISNTDESFSKDIALKDAPVYIAEQKALAIAATALPNEIVIAADTIVLLNNTILGKPTNEANAIHILTQLSGQMHQVITGICIIVNGKKYIDSDVTNVYFKTLETNTITHYVTNYKPMDKAGAYAIQEWIGVVGIEKIEGCFYNVMGLPVRKVLSILKKIIE